MSSLRHRILLLLSIAALALFGAAWWGQRQVLLPSFLALERKLALADLQRGQEALANELRFVGDYVSDWSGWDDTYRFVADRNPEFVRSNLETSVFRPNSFDFLTLVGSDRSEVWRGAMLQEQSIEVEELPLGTWPAAHPMLAPRDISDLAMGIVVTKHGPLLLASRPITDSERKAEPRGWIMMGRFLTPERIDALRGQTKLDLRITPADMGKSGNPPPGIEPRMHATVDQLAIELVQPGLRGAMDALQLRVLMPRAIVAEGRTALGFASASTGFAVLVLFAVLAAVLQWSVVGPVARLTQHALRIRADGDLNRRSGMQRRDEIGTLAREFDAMVAQLATLQQQATARARDGGMAEVARSVLHDVGNALQPVQAHIGALRAQLANGHAEDLTRVCELLGAHADDLGRWLGEDAKGRQVPGFLAALAADMQAGQQALAQEIGHLGHGLVHIQSLVDRQARQAVVAGPVEVVVLPELLANAVRMSAGELVDGAGGDVEVDAALQIVVDPHKLLAVLINLLRNARHAVRDLPRDRQRISVRARLVAADRWRLTVADRGCGISAGNLVRIFQGGFSTRPGGQGLGLHGCANSVAEMGGRLWAESDGEGCGATFHLELPVMAPAAAVVSP